MKNIQKAVECLLAFGDARDFKELKKLYKKAALLVHSDRSGSASTEFTMVDVNQAWECVNANPEKALALIEGSDVFERIQARVNSWKDDPLHDASVPSFYSVETMAKKAWSIVEESGVEFEWFSAGRSKVYIKDVNLEYTHYYGDESMYLYDLENAFKTGKTCVGYRVHLDHGRNGEFWAVWYDALKLFCESESPSSVWQWLGSLEYVDQGKYHGVCSFVTVGNSRLKIYRDEEKGAKVFSPFVVDRIKPVTEMPEKWTVLHLRKILANGQFRSYKQDYYHTDDSAYDAAVNCRKGYISNPLDSFADALTCGSMRVWERVSDDGTVALHFGAHSNDGRSLIVDLNNRYPIVDMEAEEKQYLKGEINLLEVA